MGSADRRNAEQQTLVGSVAALGTTGSEVVEKARRPRRHHRGDAARGADGISRPARERATSPRARRRGGHDPWLGSEAPNVHAAACAARGRGPDGLILLTV
jgi:hypothetical protein